METTKFANKPPCDLSERADTSEIIELLRKWSMNLKDTDELSESLERFAIAQNLSPNELSFLEQTLLRATERAFQSDTIDESDVRSFLALLSKPAGKPDTSTVADQRGYEPHPSETGVNAFLRQLKVQTHPEPFGNDWLGGVKQFNRKPHYGKANVDVNAMSAVNQLANPRLRVSNENEAIFSAVDAVGLSQRHQYKIVNNLTSEYCSSFMNCEDAEQACIELNGEMAQLIQDQNVIVTEFNSKSQRTRARIRSRL